MTAVTTVTTNIMIWQFERSNDQTPTFEHSFQRSKVCKLTVWPFEHVRTLQWFNVWMFKLLDPFVIGFFVMNSDVSLSHRNICYAIRITKSSAVSICNGWHNANMSNIPSTPIQEKSRETQINTTSDLKRKALYWSRQVELSSAGNTYMFRPRCFFHIWARLDLKWSFQYEQWNEYGNLRLLNWQGRKKKQQS